MKSLGTSLLVPSVQELVANEPSPATMTIPSRYDRSGPSDAIPVRRSDDIQLPVIDMEALLTGDPLELQRLHVACRDWGFFQVVKHGVSASVIERFKVEVKQFFNLPMEEKRKYWQTEEELEGFGQVFVMSEEQKLDWADMFYLTTLPKTLRKPHLIPMLPPRFSEALESYSSEANKLAMDILESIGSTVGMEAKEHLRELYINGMQWMRMNYYPPCPVPDKVIGLTPHGDPCGLTILLQVNKVNGLQIKKDGSWIVVEPITNAFVVNLGDIHEIVSNGEYRSVEHRAVVNPSKERLSVASFHFPGLDKVIGPMPCMINPKKPPQFRKIKVNEYLEGFLARELYSKSYLDLMRI